MLGSPVFVIGDVGAGSATAVALQKESVLARFRRRVQCRQMRSDERLNLRVVGKWQVTGPHYQAVGLTDTILWNKPLEIPRGVRGTSSGG